MLQSALLPPLAWKEIAEQREDFAGDDLTGGALAAVIIICILVIAVFAWSIAISLKWYRCGIIGGPILVIFLVLSFLGFWPIGLIVLFVSAAGKGAGAVAPAMPGANCGGL